MFIGLLFLPMLAQSSPQSNCTASAFADIPPDELLIGRRIGAGTEKVIYEGRWKEHSVAAMEILGHSKQRDTALQRTIANHPVLGSHPAIVRVLGETTDRQFILNELAEFGSLTNYDGSPSAFTQSAGIVSTAVLLEIASQILDASIALFEAGYLHRDLAARNVLLSSFSPSNPAEVRAKLTDFGLMISVGGDPAWPKEHAMGTRWMAPEAQPTAEFFFSEKSEVYSFGCLLYELFASGGVPYSNVGNNAIPQAKRRGGPKPGPLPAKCPPAVYALMELCWEFFPANRPSFGELRIMISQLQRSSGQQLRPSTKTNGAWTPLSPERILALDESSLAPQLLHITEAATSRLGMPASFHDHGHQVFSFPLLSSDFCDQLVNELATFTAEGRTTARANSNNRHSLLVVELGWDGFLSPLMERYISTLAAGLGLPGGDDGQTLRFRHAHTVQRVHENDSESPLPGSNRGSRHTDASTITLNVNLGGNWEGGDLLFFEGTGGADEQPMLRLPQQKGSAIMHAGSTVHQAGLLTSGYRLNLVIWCEWA